MATEQIRCCEWGDCDAEATVTVDYPAKVPGKPHARCTVDWEEHRYCEECAVLAEAEVNEMLREHAEGCAYCDEELGDDEYDNGAVDDSWYSDFAHCEEEIDDDEVEESDRGGTP